MLLELTGSTKSDTLNSYEVFTIDPQEMAEILAAPDEEWKAYSEWSEQVEVSLAPATLYIDPKDGKVKQIPEPPSKGRIGGIEI